MINYYKSVTSSSNVLGQIEIQDYLNKIKKGDKNLNNIKLARDLYFENKAEYIKIKTNILPCYTLNFTFKNYRRNKDLIDSTGFIYIDVDGNTNIDFNNPLIYSTWLSLSGKGRGILVKVNNLTKLNYKSNYNLISRELGINSDNGARKITQLNVLSFDPQIYFNDKSEIWEAKDVNSNTNKKTHYSGNLKKDIIPNVMGLFDNQIRYDNLNELIENVEFNGDVIHDFKTKVSYSKTHIPFRGIKNGSRNQYLSGIAYQHRALNPTIEKSHLFRFINKINHEKCFDPLPNNQINAIINSIMNIENLVPVKNAERRFLFSSDYQLTLKEKRQVVIKAINSDRVENSKMKIEKVIEDWDFDTKGKITQKAIATNIPMNIKTVKKYYPLFKSDIQMLNNTYFKKS